MFFSHIDAVRFFTQQYKATVNYIDDCIDYNSEGEQEILCLSFGDLDIINKLRTKEDMDFIDMFSDIAPMEELNSLSLVYTYSKKDGFNFCVRGKATRLFYLASIFNRDLSRVVLNNVNIEQAKNEVLDFFA